MIDVKLDRNDRTDLYEQVAGEIRRSIADGEAQPGERLPPAKDLAAVLGVNANTVLRALRLLRDEGLLDFRRGGVSPSLPHPTWRGGATVVRTRGIRPPPRAQHPGAHRHHRRPELTLGPDFDGSPLGARSPLALSA